MVILNKIYTKTGDQGQTSLGNGSRVEKHSLRVNAYGTVDETNAALGLARLHASGELDDKMANIPNDLGSPLSLSIMQRNRKPNIIPMWSNETDKINY